MLTAEELDALRAAIPADPDLTGLLGTLRARAAGVLEKLPVVPQVKALLSRDGGFCPTDGTPLRFDPWSPDQHRCPRCGQAWSGERHHRNWARAQHLWVAERTAELALLAVVDNEPRAGTRAAELIAAYDELYFQLPNRDNVLGPSHLFFSTYLESLWITSYLAGAFFLREGGLLSEERIDGVNRVAEEAAGLIGEFNEGFSNRQTWNAAALSALGAWFGDEELGQTAVESRTGLLGHLADGFGEDGLWWEGENYHLFALRGLMQGIHWARALGFDLLEDSEVRDHFRSALLAPSRTALPDYTYPARRDARYGVSLAQPASLELWEIGRAWLGEDERLDAWLAALYASPPASRPAEHYDAWLHEAGMPAAAPVHRGRAGLSWWALTTMQPAPASVPEWQPESGLLQSQGLAVLREGDRYASLECGPAIGGHGHPDRLHLTLHAGGVHWLPDQGTGSYVQPSLAWYRSALAHNAPLLDGENAGGEHAWCAAFEAKDSWAWCRGRAGAISRTLIAGPGHLVDVLEIESETVRRIELPWHLQGKLTVATPGEWQATELTSPLVSRAERFLPREPGPLRIEAYDATTRRSLTAWMLVPEAELIIATAPGLPLSPEPRPFLLLRGTAETVRWVTVLDVAPEDSPDHLSAVEADPSHVKVTTGRGPIRYRFTPAGLEIEHDGGTERLTGLRRQPRMPSEDRSLRSDAEAVALRIVDTPALDGTLDGFVLDAPLLLDTELQYRRSEEPYDPERFSARAWANWDGESLYLAVSVIKAESIFRAADAPPLQLDNEADDIHSDGIQVYLGDADQALGFLVVPQQGNTLRIRSIEMAPTPEHGSPDHLPVKGAWATTDEGYLVTLRIADPRFRLLGPGARLHFDLLINEMEPGRERRAGQLIWSGGNGWVYLRGDRHDLAQAGILELG